MHTALRCSVAHIHYPQCHVGPLDARTGIYGSALGSYPAKHQHLVCVCEALGFKVCCLCAGGYQQRRVALPKFCADSYARRDDGELQSEHNGPAVHSSGTAAT